MKKTNNLDRLVGAYEANFKFYEENQWYLRHYASRISAVLSRDEYNTMLSLGIGHEEVCGSILKALDRHLVSYRLLEGSQDIIERFTASHVLPPTVELVHTFFEEYETTETFDVIEMGFVLEHVDDPTCLIKKYREYLEPNGIMFIAVPNARSLHRLIGHEAGLLPDLYALSSYDLELGHKRYFDLDSITKLVREAGLKISHQQGLMLKPVTGDQIRQLGWGDNIIQALMKIGDSYPEIANCILIEASR